MGSSSVKYGALSTQHLYGPPQLYVDNLGVSPDHQRQQIATLLLRKSFDRAKHTNPSRPAS
jgi:ribosomal protein S18 acetylase RimI-like enzyme